MLRPVLSQVIRQLFDGHPVDARTALVRLDATQRFLQVLSLTHCLHQRIRDRWAFGLALRHDRFGILTTDKRGHILVCRGEDQLELFGQPLSVHESCVLIATPFIPFSGTVRAFGAVSLPGQPARVRRLLCRLLTSAQSRQALPQRALTRLL